MTESTGLIPQPFSVTSSPVSGRVLLEASAGTGKTFSVTKIALRYLLAGTALPNILLVTFTNLATAELRSALSAELYAALTMVDSLVERFGALTQQSIEALLDQPDSVEAEDIILLQILANLSAEDLAEAQRRLHIAVKSTDLASVWTLHQFAIQVMAENTFSVSQPFGQTVELELTQYETQTILDFMRLHYVDGNRPQFDDKAVEAAYTSAMPVLSQAQLLSLLRLQRNKPDIEFYSRYEGADESLNDQSEEPLQWKAGSDISESLEAAEKAFDSVLAEYRQMGQEFSAWLTALEPKCNKNTFAAKRRDLILRQLDSWTKMGASLAVLQDIKTDKTAHAVNYIFSLAADYFATKVITKKHQAEFEAPKLMRLVSTLQQQFEIYQQQKSDITSQFIHYASCWLTQRFQVLLSKDYIVEASAAFRYLADALASENGELIAAKMRQKFSLTIVDEFQDTDPLQFEILDKLFPDKEHHNLVLVGDPKQAIYQFRGADIYAYLAVINSVRTYYYLDTNFRSDALLVAGVNQCFIDEGRAEGSPSFVLENIRFTPVKANHQIPRLELADEISSVPLQVCLQPAELNAESAMKNSLAEMTRQIQQLLQDGNIIRKGEQQRPTSAADIAVLVNSNNDAKAVYRYCQKVGLPSVLHSADSVYQADIAKPLLWLLQTMRDGGRSDYLTALMMTDFFGMTAEEILQEKVSANWARYLAALQRSQLIWQQQGIASAIALVSQEMDLDQRLLQRSQTRAIADFEHLLELLHQYEQEHQANSDQVLQWFQKRVMAEEVEDDLGAEVAQRRIDTDEAAITIITIHKSKGLEYPIVFCPLLHKLGGSNRHSDLSYHQLVKDREGAESNTEADSDRYRLIYVADSKAPHISSPEREHMQQQSDMEMLAERVRLLYVAMTRASMRLVLIDQCVSPKNNPMQHLLGINAAGGSKNEELFLKRYQQLAEKLPESIEITELGFDLRQPFFTGANEQTSGNELVATAFTRHLRPSWIFTSFSALKSASEKLAQKRESISDIAEVAEDKLAESSGEQNQLAITATDDSPTEQLSTTVADEADSEAEQLETEEVELPYRYLYPAGAQYGTLIHNAFEEVPLADFVKYAARDQQELHNDKVESTLQQLITNANLPRAVDVKGLHDWLGACADKQMVSGFSLAEISAEALPEIEFLLPISERGLASFQQELKSLAHHFPGVEEWLDNHPLQLQALAPRGYIKGFIDLTLRHDGKYAILDYKSNHLGSDQAGYQPEALRAVMVETGYWLQFVIYSLALHRWLGQRLANYNYSEHMLGGVFMFLRGMDTETAYGEGEFFACLTEAEMLRLDMALSRYGFE